MACHSPRHGGELEVCSPCHFLVCLQATEQASTEFIFSTFLHRACACWEVVGFWGTSLMAGISMCTQRALAKGELQQCSKRKEKAGSKKGKRGVKRIHLNVAELS